MLILSRKTLESIMIGDDITVTVLSVDRNRVRLGIKAPKNVAVHREEIYERIQLERNSPIASGGAHPARGGERQEDPRNEQG